MSMAQGFAQGFGMMNQYMTQKSEQERQAAQDAENNRRYQEGIDWRNKTYTDQQTRQQKQDEESAQDRAIKYGAMGIDTINMTPEQQVGYAQNLAAVKTQQEAEDRQWARKKDEADIGYKKAQTGKAYLEAKSAELQLSNDTVQAGMRAAMMGDYEGAQKMLPPDLIKNWAKRSPAVDTYIEQAGQIIQHLNGAKTPEEKTYYNDMLTAHLRADTDEAKHLFNTVGYESYMDRVRQDPDIESISHKSWMPIKGGFVPMMEIKYKEGSGKKSGVYPATKNKSSSPDDIVAVVDGRTLTSRALEAQKVMQGARKMIEENPELAQSLGFKPVDKYQVTYAGKVFDKRNGKEVPQDEPNAGQGVNYKAEEQIRKAADSDLRSANMNIKRIHEQLGNVMVQSNPEMVRKLNEELAYYDNKAKGASARLMQMYQGETFPITQGESIPQQAQGMQPTTGGANTGGSKFSFGKIGIDPSSLPDKK